jgi:hypothetical protein
MNGAAGIDTADYSGATSAVAVNLTVTTRRPPAARAAIR